MGKFRCITMCKNLHTFTTFIDVNVFCENDNSLKQHLSKGENDPLHLSEQGVKLFASRIKYALRSHLHLPSGRGRARSSAAPPFDPRSREGGFVPPPRGGQRGGRGTANRASTRRGRWNNIRVTDVVHHV